MCWHDICIISYHGQSSNASAYPLLGPGLSFEMLARSIQSATDAPRAAVEKGGYPRIQRKQKNYGKGQTQPSSGSHSRQGWADPAFKEYNHVDIVTRLPDRTGVVSTINQVAQQDKFRLAVLYGKAVIADPDAKEVYEDASARKGMSAFALERGRFLKPPVDRRDRYVGVHGPDRSDHSRARH